MSDVYDAGDNLADSSFLDSSPTSTVSNSDLGDLSLGSPAAPAITNSSGAPVLTMPQSVTAAGNDILGDITKLVTGVYAGEAQIATAQGAVKVAQIKAANSAAVAQATPNLLLIGGALLVGVVLLHAVSDK